MCGGFCHKIIPNSISWKIHKTCKLIQTKGWLQHWHSIHHMQVICENENFLQRILTNILLTHWGRVMHMCVSKVGHQVGTYKPTGFQSPLQCSYRLNPSKAMIMAHKKNTLWYQYNFMLSYIILWLFVWCLCLYCIYESANSVLQ